MQITSLFLLGIVVIACFFSKVESLSCHQCTAVGGIQGGCADPIDKKSYPSQPCTNTLADVCRKERLGSGIVTRGCAVKGNSNLGCGNVGRIFTCLCDRDGCNGSANVTPHFLALTLVASFLTMYRLA